jgi:hypothetical protein
MSDQSSSIIGFPMPEDFDVVRYEAVHSRVTASKEASPESYNEFAGAWRAVAYRCRSCQEHDLALTESIQRAGSAPPQPERYLQERELFCFFVTGLAAIESLYYAAFAIASMLDSANFPMESSSDLRSINPRKTAERFSVCFREERLTRALQTTLNDDAYSEWKRIRNVLTHRTSPGRIIHFSTKGPPRPPDWKLGIRIDDSTTRSRRKWLAREVNLLMKELCRFVEAKL